MDANEEPYRWIFLALLLPTRAVSGYFRSRRHSREA